jgi:hypothetical protein
MCLPCNVCRTQVAVRGVAGVQRMLSVVVCPAVVVLGQEWQALPLACTSNRAHLMLVTPHGVGSLVPASWLICLAAGHPLLLRKGVITTL